MMNDVGPREDVTSGDIVLCMNPVTRVNAPYSMIAHLFRKNSAEAPVSFCDQKRFTSSVKVMTHS